jgi:hypothetical protein
MDSQRTGVGVFFVEVGPRCIPVCAINSLLNQGAVDARQCDFFAFYD